MPTWGVSRAPRLSEPLFASTIAPAMSHLGTIYVGGNPGHRVKCLCCSIDTTTGSWRRGWLLPDMNHVNFCNRPAGGREGGQPRGLGRTALGHRCAAAVPPAARKVWATRPSIPPLPQVWPALAEGGPPRQPGRAACCRGAQACGCRRRCWRHGGCGRQAPRGCGPRGRAAPQGSPPAAGAGWAGAHAATAAPAPHHRGGGRQRGRRQPQQRRRSRRLLALQPAHGEPVRGAGCL